MQFHKLVTPATQEAEEAQFQIQDQSGQLADQLATKFKGLKMLLCGRELLIQIPSMPSQTYQNMLASDNIGQMEQRFPFWHF